MFIPIRADEVSGTNVIVIDILRKIIFSEMAICDLSSRNPNVLYELGIRQSFDLPVTLIKDELTPRVFDIQGFRDVLYNKSLRFDLVTDAVDRLANSLRETYENKGKDINSIVELIGVTKATIKDPIRISPETEVVLNALNDLSHRFSLFERRKSELTPESIQSAQVIKSVMLKDKTYVGIGEKIMSVKYGEGVVLDFIPLDGDQIGVFIQFADKSRTIYSHSSDIHNHPETIPF